MCWCVCDVCTGYPCGLELHIGFFGEGGHLRKSLEVPFSLWRMFMCTLMCVCARVWAFAVFYHEQSFPACFHSYCWLTSPGATKAIRGRAI